VEAGRSTDRKEHNGARINSWSAIHKIEHKLGCGTGNVDLVYSSTLLASVPAQLASCR
jgi:hypothetical protein